MAKFAKIVLSVIIAWLIVLCLSSCVRYKTSSTHTRDTVFVEQRDTVYVDPDTVAIHRVHKVIDSVFIEIEKDCPKAKANIQELKKETKEACTLRSLTGGSIRVWFPMLKDSIVIVFDEGITTAYGSGKDQIITDTTTNNIVKEDSGFKRMLDRLLPWGILIALVVGFIVGRFMKFG